jgi:hypothetical protein
VLLDEIKGEVEGRPGLEIVSQTVNVRMGEIRESMRCAGKADHEKKLLMSSSSMGMLASIRHEHEQEPNSIYINRLYEERRKTLGQRDKSSGFKKTGVINPYQLNLHDARENG